MPPDPAKTDLTDSQGRPLNFFMDKKGKQTSPLVDLSWLNGADAEVGIRPMAADKRFGRRKKSFPHDANSLPITCVAGYG